MKESYRKGVATHPDPESCVASRKATTEALTGAHVGRVLSCEIKEGKPWTGKLGANITIEEGNAGSGNSDHSFSGNSDHTPSGKSGRLKPSRPGQTLAVTHSEGRN